MDRDPGLYFVSNPSFSQDYNFFMKLFEYILGLEDILYKRNLIYNLDFNAQHVSLLFSIANLLKYTRIELEHTNYYIHIYEENNE